MEIPSEIVALVVGFFLLLFGYRVKKIAITIIWFIIGYWLVSLFVDQIIADQMWQFILCCVGGLVLGMFGMTIERFAIFVSVGATFAMFTIQNFGPITDWVLPTIAVAVGVVAGVIGVWLVKPMIILATAIEGAHLVSVSGLALLNFPQPEWFLVLLLAVAAFGIVFQWNNCRKIP